MESKKNLSENKEPAKTETVYVALRLDDFVQEKPVFNLSSEEHKSSARDDFLKNSKKILESLSSYYLSEIPVHDDITDAAKVKEKSYMNARYDEDDEPSVKKEEDWIIIALKVPKEFLTERDETVMQQSFSLTSFASYEPQKTGRKEKILHIDIPTPDGKLRSLYNEKNVTVDVVLDYQLQKRGAPPGGARFG